MKVFNIYCDESCHLEHDNCAVMVLGAVWCPVDRRAEISERLREIKIRHHFAPDFEIKWNKVSPAGTKFYQDIIEYFFKEPNLHFRGLLVPDKSQLRHENFNHTHDEFYYKMYFDLLKVILEPDAGYNIYLDMKDTHGTPKIKKLEEVLSNNQYDFSRKIILKIQEVQSRQVPLIQMTDLFAGAVGYANRDLSKNAGKVALINRIKALSGYSLKNSTLLRESKFNLFRWHGKPFSD